MNTCLTHFFFIKNLNFFEKNGLVRVRDMQTDPW